MEPYVSNIVFMSFFMYHISDILDNEWREKYVKYFPRTTRLIKIACQSCHYQCAIAQMMMSLIFVRRDAGSNSQKDI
jgi:hypothetical protein